ncbi:hypothetical protein [Mesotoga sp.]|uniref:hypothetical protein n=1 Tax=Mesotoga sp. TaxID=2053577 RepID=UPI00345E356D
MKHPKARIIDPEFKLRLAKEFAETLVGGYGARGLPGVVKRRRFTLQSSSGACPENLLFRVISDLIPVSRGLEPPAESGINFLRGESHFPGSFSGHCFLLLT